MLGGGGRKEGKGRAREGGVVAGISKQSKHVHKHIFGHYTLVPTRHSTRAWRRTTTTKIDDIISSMALLLILMHPSVVCRDTCCHNGRDRK